MGNAFNANYTEINENFKKIFSAITIGEVIWFFPESMIFVLRP
jgi:hypothetical protein